MASSSRPGVLVAAVIGAIFVAIRFIIDPFNGGGSDIHESRGLGLYLAGAGAVISLIGCVNAFRDREAWAERAGFDDDDDDDEDEDDIDGEAYGYDPDEQDDLIRRINSSLERQPSADRPPRHAPRPETEQDRRRAEREQRRGARPRRAGATAAHRSPEPPRPPSYGRRRPVEEGSRWTSASSGSVTGCWWPPAP